MISFHRSSISQTKNVLLKKSENKNDLKEFSSIPPTIRQKYCLLCGTLMLRFKFTNKKNRLTDETRSIHRLCVCIDIYKGQLQ